MTPNELGDDLGTEWGPGVRDIVVLADCCSVVEGFRGIAIGDDLRVVSPGGLEIIMIERLTKMFSFGNILSAASSVSPMSFSDL